MEKAESTKGLVFNLQHYSIHDGPGIRTTVFLNGCALRCIWCQNPESQSIEPQIFFTSERCTGCGTCVTECPSTAITFRDGKSQTHRSLCDGCGKCAEVCRNEARSLVGKEMTAAEVFKDVNSDAIFYQNSGGGVTLSGGDPLTQPRFSLAILKLCKRAGMHTAIETSGFANWEVFKEILEYTDMALYDLKHMDAEEHRKWTGISNELILENAWRIIKELPAVTFVARMPLIPGYNDSKENIAATTKFIRELSPSIKVHLLPYHRLGETKYERLEEIGKIIRIQPPTDEYMEEIRHSFESFGLTAITGG